MTKVEIQFELAGAIEETDEKLERLFNLLIDELRAEKVEVSESNGLRFARSIFVSKSA